MFITSLNRSVNVQVVMNHAKMVAGVKVRTIVKSFPRQIVHHNVFKEGVLDQIQENVVIYFVLVDVLVPNKVTAWYVVIFLLPVDTIHL